MKLFGMVFSSSSAQRRWSVANGGAITGLATYTAAATGAHPWTAGADYDFSGSGTYTYNSSSGTVDSLRFSLPKTSGGTLTLTETGALTITSGGVLFTSGTTCIQQSGSITSGNGNDLVFVMNNTGGYAVRLLEYSKIVDNGATHHDLA